LELAGAVGSSKVSTGGQSELEGLQLEALGPATLVVLAAAYGVLGYLGLVDGPIDPDAFLVGISLLATVGAATWLTGRRPRLAARVLVGGLVVSLGLALHLHPSFGVAAMFGPAVILAGVLLGWRFSVAPAALGTAAVLIALKVPTTGPSLDNVLLPLSIWSGLPLSWLLTRPARTALSWAWHSYDQALAMAEQLRDRQGELGRLSKSLQETCYRLECVNRELEEARQAAEEARRLKAQFAASISHELRTPLNLIIGFSEMMVLAPRAYRGERLPERYQGDVEAIYRNACHLSDLVDDVLELSQIDANRLGLEKELVSLAEVVDEAVAAVASMFRDKQLALITHIPSDIPPLYADRTRIRQVLINLLNNAARFTEEGGVRISAEADGHEVVVSVADTGVGIPPRDIPRVFEEFHQIERPGRLSQGGSGLGLTITKRFVELHGGSIWVESTPGVGSTFRFSLPLCGNVAALPSRTNWTTRVRPADGAEQRKSVLVLGDDSEPLRILQRHLDGYQVVRATSVRDACRRASRGEACAVIATSPEATEDWQRQRAVDGEAGSLPLISCTFRTIRDVRVRLGVAEYLVKPVSRDLVKTVLRRLGRGVRDLLVVDDDPEMLRLLGQMIASISGQYRVRLASDGVTALAQMRESRPGAVVLDLIMPGIDGYAVLEEMRGDEELRSVPVVVVTARGAEEETVVATTLSVSRGEGLSVAETVRCLKASLDGLLRPWQPAPERRAELAV